MARNRPSEAKGKEGQCPSLPVASPGCDAMPGDPAPMPAPRRSPRASPTTTKQARRLPGMSRHSSGQARVRLNGRAYYLGPWGDPDTHARYAELLRQWVAAGRQPIGPRLPHAGELSYAVRELLAEHRAWIDSTGRYTKRGRPTSYRTMVETAFQPFEDFAGALPVRKLTEHVLLQWRDRLEVEHPGMVRETINRKVRIVLGALRWGRGRGLVPAAVWASCSAVVPLKRGECGNRPEHARPRRAVAAEEVEQVAAHCPPAVAAAMRLQAATAMRAGEACSLRWADVDKAGPDGTWIYTVWREFPAHFARGRARACEPHRRPTSCRRARSYERGLAPVRQAPALAVALRRAARSGGREAVGRVPAGDCRGRRRRPGVSRSPRAQAGGGGRENAPGGLRFRAWRRPSSWRWPVA
jgi:integrase